MSEESNLDENALNAINFRDSGLMAEVLGVDARVFFVFLVLLFVHTKVVFFSCLLFVGFFGLVRYFRMTPEIFLSWIWFSLSGTLRSWQTKRLMHLRGDLHFHD